ncbi:hypothetical protein SG34_026670 [Thalassomonas viridans]|uniref:Uncharacterized protein n=1 Tax=Thalassomonas viridans TaxID=137584 RepID=A0AAE9Z415_9GAMM|nr:hypothetical protein [Thalassomonas viridans]WDE04853.1 hypothetical protein SG34_026670 [Thalassomonas viridans]
MNRHTKLAILIAPVLFIAGFIASDYYMEHQAAQDKVFYLTQQNNCDVLADKCVLESGEFLVSVSDHKGVTRINATFPLDTVVLMLVNDDNSQQIYQLAMADTPYYWQAKTDLRESIPQAGDSRKLRLVAKIKGGSYISEFVSTTLSR